MAQKKAEPKSGKTIRKTRKQNKYTDHYKVDFFLGLILFFFAVYIIIAMVSYLLTGTEDQSILENMRSGEWMNPNHEFVNYCGSLGAILSYFLITENFGFPAFLIPLFLILVGFQLIRAYHLRLWQWFFGMAFTMIWCSVTFAKFLTPVMGSLFFNPGGEHGLFCVQKLEGMVGPPGLTVILIVTAIAFLTYLTTETITVVVKILHPSKYLKVPFSITNGLKANPAEEEELSDQNLYGKDAEEDGESDRDGEPSNPEGETTLKNGVIDLNEKDREEENAAGSAIPATPPDLSEDAAGTGLPPSPLTTGTPSYLASQRAARLKEEEEASKNVGMEIEIAKEGDRATKRTVNNENILKTPINPREPFTNYKYPTLDLLKKYGDEEKPYIDEQEQIANKNRISEVLHNFGVEIRSIRATVGPTITLYEIQPAEGVRISKIKNLEDDIALSLSALGIRIIAPIPGKGTIGIEVPNAKPNIVSMESILNSRKFQETKMELPLALGKTITNDVFMVDLAKIPHLLVAGATGQGKSVGLNAMITSLLYKKHPNELKFVLVDPKKVEFSVYTKIAKHFMAVVDEEDEPIITDVTKVVRTLNSLCKLMDHRYDLLKMAGARNIKEYNAKFVNHRLDLTKGHQYMPYIVVVIDEFGDLIMTAGKEIELPIARIAQLARAVGIHMIIATQRPTTNIITGNIKANFPGRIAFKVAAAVDSKTILDRSGANQLIGRGDMLYVNGNEPVRVQCAFVDTPEIERINDYIASQPGPVEPMELPEPDDKNEADDSSLKTRSLDPYFEEAAHTIVLSQTGSTSMIQRRFSIGYNRAGRLMDQLEAAGIVGTAQGSKPREVLVQDENQLNTILAQIRG
ncbi:MAG: DNA translocase FtsK [Prevotella sp.]|jgi:S-DNA-T family DNA segregation ATPase FtsK/SpoIIIE|nr:MULTISPECIES: DNA translocase FtsK [unclassified Prevotella]MCH3992094.1 DNA translocase FtsK [Prevotella sp.]MCH4185804.1 DNA translocase FtsK [Prevotella sp.]MCH4251030.1 DNA translocase FtsK [Prevotella sp.]MCI1473531.1 DNA translocase FtsK [Prevotella sp.]MCI1518552.1 DNA translocase FtsK [Prevotella sp.]